MSSKRRLRRNACTGKVRYTTDAEARVAVTEIIRAGRGFRSKGRLGVYQCDWCGGGFHVGHRGGRAA